MDLGGRNGIPCEITSIDGRVAKRTKSILETTGRLGVNGREVWLYLVARKFVNIYDGGLKW